MSRNTGFEGPSDDWNDVPFAPVRIQMSVGHSEVAETRLETFDGYCYKKLAIDREIAYLPEPWG
jgi:hypothetical protein